MYGIKAPFYIPVIISPGAQPETPLDLRMQMRTSAQTKTRVPERRKGEAAEEEEGEPTLVVGHGRVFTNLSFGAFNERLSGPRHTPPHPPKVRCPPTFPDRSVDVIVCASLSVFATEVWGGRRDAGDWNSRYYDWKNRARQRGGRKKKTKREEKIVSGIVQVWQEWSSVTLSVPQPHFFFFFVHPSTVSAQRLFDTHTHTPAQEKHSLSHHGWLNTITRLFFPPPVILHTLSLHSKLLFVQMLFSFFFPPLSIAQSCL